MTQLERISIPLGSTVSVERLDGTVETYVFRGTQEDGGIYEDAEGKRHKNIDGVYRQLKIDAGPWPQ